MPLQDGTEGVLFTWQMVSISDGIAHWVLAFMGVEAEFQ
jgi:hypothetical protein